MKIYINKTDDSRYGVKKEGAKRNSKVFDNYNDAVDYANKLANEENATIINNVVIEKAVTTFKKSHISIKIFFIILLIAIVAVAVYIFLNKDKFNFLKPAESSTVESSTDDHNHVIGDAEFQIHFLELGNDNTGDSTYIKAGDIDILIDAGSRQNSSTAIKSYIDQYCTDGKLEYVISTHAHQDHIAGFVGTSDNKTYDGIFYQYKIDTLIDFSLTNQDESKASSLYGKYKTARDYLISNGTKHYTAAECFKNENGASSTYTLGNDYTKLEILYNPYYFEKSSDENNYSVCTLFTHNSKKFLFTGDLEKEGEEALAEHYKTNDGLGHVDLFKAGHHGSKTSSNDCLLELITPDICSVCCCAGNSEYTATYTETFPTQDFINRIAKYTDKVYATTAYDTTTNTFGSLNGNIVIISKNNQLEINCSNNNTILKDSNWFNKTIYVDEKGKFCPSKGSDNYFTENTPGVKSVPQRVWPTA